MSTTAAVIVLIVITVFASSVSERFDRLEARIAQACHAGPVSAGPRP